MPSYLTLGYWKKKIVAVFFTLIISAIYTFSLVLVSFGKLIARLLFNFLNFDKGYIFIFEVFRFTMPVITLFILFVVMYNYLPCKTINIKKVFPGAIFATTLWLLISQMFSYYIDYFATTEQAYGSLGSIIMLLLWLQWCSIAIMLGAELNSTLIKKSSLKFTRP